MSEVRELEPKQVWNHFEDLNATPRPSKQEERVIKFMEDFGSGLGLKTYTDAAGNVIIKKKASAGMENRKTVVMQAHLDMVHQKNADTNFDFNTEGIQSYIDQDWVKAKGTTLGADNGMGVASIMAVLASEDLVHPEIEALFTIDEETGMTGAKEMDGSLLDGQILLNLDTEDDDELSIGCAGGIDTNTSYSYKTEPIADNSLSYEIKVKGLLGGHSGMDIDSGRGNANKWMSRLLWTISKELKIQLISFDGGGLRNAIPRESQCVIAISKNDSELFHSIFKGMCETFKSEYKPIEIHQQIECSETSAMEDAVSDNDFNKILNTLCAVHNGVYRMSPDIEGLVETSSSLARVEIKNGSFITQSLQRSSVDSTRDEVAMTIKSCFENMGCEVVQSGEYPGWQPNPNSEILEIMEQLYKDMFNENPQVKACHAGLECGILGKHLPGVDMISFGPNIRAAHSPDEKVQISSVQKFWKFYLETLKQIPEQ